MPTGHFFRTAEHRRNISKALKGRPVWWMTEDVKRKISKTLKGRPHTKEHNKKVSDALTGRKRKPFSDEWKKNLSLGNKRKWERGCFDSRGERWKKNISKTRKEQGVARGEKNPNWRGGKTPISFVVRRLDEYKEWRRAVFRRDNYTCTACGVRGGELEAHHIEPLSIILKRNEIETQEQMVACAELWDVENGRTLCKVCHQGTDSYGWKGWNSFLTRFVKSSEEAGREATKEVVRA